MTARFAGSRSLDERRRRRLATESDNAVYAATDRMSPNTALAEQAPCERAALLAQAVVPVKLWMHWMFGIVGLCVAAGILAGAYYEAVCVRSVGLGFSRLFGLSGGTLVSSFSSTLLMLSGQVALLIWWVRSNSLRDFAGQYQIWPWAAAAWFLAAFSVATDGHLAVGEMILWTLNANLPNGLAHGWIVPTVLAGTVLLWNLHRELGDGHSSLSMIWLAAVCCLVSVVLTLLPQHAEKTLEWSLLKTGSAMLGHLCLFLSMTMHARHVVHVSSDPPQAPPSSPKAPRRSFELPKLPKFSWPSRKRRAAVADKGTASGSDGKQAAAVTKPSAKQTQQTVTRGAKTEARTSHASSNENEADPLTTAHAASEPVLDQKRPFSATTEVRIDPPESDMPNLKGLSKRDRRKAQQEFRERLRAGQSVD